jgi:hypothetical protein
MVGEGFTKAKVLQLEQGACGDSSRGSPAARVTAGEVALLHLAVRERGLSTGPQATVLGGEGDEKGQQRREAFLSRVYVQHNARAHVYT